MAGGYRDVSPAATLAARGAGPPDRRPRAHEYTGELGHIAGAELVPLATVLDASRAWERERDVILICRSGARSGRAAEALVAAGFARS
jgi:rhodanese-related sulfurtransferase